MEFLKQTTKERAGTIDGLNLFFGALLGANLGTLDELDMEDYVKFTILLAGTVMALRMVSTSERRVYAIATAGLYAGLIFAILLIPSIQPSGLAEKDLHRLLATLGIWLGSVLLMELWPVKASEAAQTS